MDKSGIEKERNKKQDAYMTIEATLLFPMIFGGILFTISLGLYLYDAAVLKQVTSVAALRGSLEYEMNQNEIKAMVNTEIEELIKERLLFVSKIEKNVNVTEAKVQVRLKSNINLPFLGIPFMDFKWQELDFVSDAKRVRPVKIIRDARRLYGS